VSALANVALVAVALLADSPLVRRGARALAGPCPRRPPPDVDEAEAWEQINRRTVVAGASGDAEGYARLKPKFWLATIRLCASGVRR
jgi:hypothetical protein